MSQTAPVAPASATARPDVSGAIAAAASATGVDFRYLLGQARLESSLDPSARAATSSAAGLFQFTHGTWLAMLDRHGAENGLGWASDAITGGRIADPALREAIMALRYDPQASALMAGELAAENRTALLGVLGREPDAAELYLAHFLGAGGAGTFLTALAADPQASAAAVLPEAAAANRAIFYGADGAPRSLEAVMGLLRGRLETAMGGSAPATGRLVASPVAAPERASMAQTLADAFGGTSGVALPAQVRTAYAQFKAFGL